jgi:Spy/CpxP family protein refolding chaperone
MPSLKFLRSAANRTAALLVPFILGANVALAAAPGLPDLGLPFGNHFAAMKAKLNLNAAQDVQYVAAMQASIKANESARKARVAAAATAKAELAKADPDFARLLNLRDETQAATATERKAAINEWVKFTQILTAEQKAMMRGQLLDRVSRADDMREKFRQRHGG